MSRLLKVSAIAAMAVSAWALLLILAAVAYLLLTMALVSVGQAHDFYSTLHERLEPIGQLCCGGDDPARGTTGDCEAVDYEILPNGDAVFNSRRYGARVHIAKEKITWSFVPGGEAWEAHWCGVPRTKVSMAPIDGLNPDPLFWSYCAFIAPGGV